MVKTLCIDHVHARHRMPAMRCPSHNRSQTRTE